MQREIGKPTGELHGRDWRLGSLSLAGQRPRAAERHRARVHPFFRHITPRPPRRLALLRICRPPYRQPRPLWLTEREHIVGTLRETGWVVGGPKGMKHSTLQKRIKARHLPCRFVPPKWRLCPSSSTRRWHFLSLSRTISARPIHNSLFTIVL